MKKAVYTLIGIVVILAGLLVQGCGGGYARDSSNANDIGKALFGNDADTTAED